MAKYTIRLPRLPVNWQDQPQLFERYWDEAMTRLEDTLNAILTIPELQDAIDAAQSAANNANSAAATAQAAADASAAAAQATAKETSIVNSYVNGFTPPLLSVTTSGVVTIANHDRVYGDPTIDPTVSVTGATVNTMATEGQVVRIYYDDPARAGGTVSYQWTIDPNPVPVQGGSRHSVGVVTIPETGQPPSDGNYIKPPGYVERISTL